MSMNQLTQQIAPQYSSLTDTVRGVVSPFVNLAEQAASLPLGIADQVAAPFVNAPANYPNLTKAIGGLSRVAMGLGGDPLAASKADYYRALGGAQTFDMNQSQRFNEAMAEVQRMIPNFDPSNEGHYQAALGTVMRIAGPEAGIDFANQFKPDDKSELIRNLKNDYGKSQEELQMIEDAYVKITSIGEGPISATTMLTAYAKLLDPGSVVREGEQRVLERAGGLNNRFIKALNEFDGGKLPGPIRADIIKEASTLYNNQVITGNKRRDSFREYASTALELPPKIVDSIVGKSAPLPTAYVDGNGKPSDRYNFESRPGAPEIEPDANGQVPAGQVVWDKDSASWVFIQYDTSAPFGIRIHDLEED